MIGYPELNSSRMRWNNVSEFASPVCDLIKSECEVRDVMPIYEYRCGNCRRRVSIFSRGFESDSSLACPQCNSTDLTRLFSSFRIGKGDTYYRKDFYEDILGDHQLVRGLESSDPKALAEWNRRMMNATGDYPIGNYTMQATYGIHSNSTSVNMTESKQTTLKLGGFVIPEFPPLITLPLFISATLLIALAYRRKFALK